MIYPGKISASPSGLVEQMQPGSAADFAAPEVTRSADSEYPIVRTVTSGTSPALTEPEAVLVLIKATTLITTAFCLTAFAT